MWRRRSLKAVLWRWFRSAVVRLSVPSPVGLWEVCWTNQTCTGSTEHIAVFIRALSGSNTEKSELRTDGGGSPQRFFLPVFLYFFDIFLRFFFSCESPATLCFSVAWININKRDSREKKTEIYNLYYTVLWTKYKSITLCYIYIIIFLDFSSWDGRILLVLLVIITLFWAPLLTLIVLNKILFIVSVRDRPYQQEWLMSQCPTCVSSIGVEKCLERGRRYSTAKTQRGSCSVEPKQSKGLLTRADRLRPLHRHTDTDLILLKKIKHNV